MKNIEKNSAKLVIFVFVFCAVHKYNTVTSKYLRHEINKLKKKFNRNLGYSTGNFHLFMHLFGYYMDFIYSWGGSPSVYGQILVSYVLWLYYL